MNLGVIFLNCDLNNLYQVLLSYSDDILLIVYIHVL